MAIDAANTQVPKLSELLCQVPGICAHTAVRRRTTKLRMAANNLKPGSLAVIAREILANAEALDQAAASRGVAPPSLAEWTLPDLSLAEEGLRRALIDGCHRLKLISSGPVGQFYDVAFNFTDTLSLRFLHENAVFAHIPDDGAISYEQLANEAGLDPVLMRRFLHHGMLNGFAQELSPGLVSHTASSRLWKHSDGMRDTISFLIEDIGPGARNVVQAQRKWPGSGEPNETGVNIAENSTDPFYLHLAKDEERSRRFGNGMKFIAHADLYAFDIRHLLNSFAWKSVDRPGAIIVDVGGGHGTVSQAIHDITTHVKFIVQDLPGTAQKGADGLAEQYKERITFMPHDFFNPQPIKQADVYIFRWILHNWADKYAVKILKNIVDAARPGSKIIAQEQMPDSVSEGPRWSTKSKRNLDMIQATGWNSLERTEEDWKALFRETDPKLHFCRTVTPEGSCQTLVEVEVGN